MLAIENMGLGFWECRVCSATFVTYEVYGYDTGTPVHCGCGTDAVELSGEQRDALLAAYKLGGQAAIDVLWGKPSRQKLVGRKPHGSG